MLNQSVLDQNVPTKQKYMLAGLCKDGFNWNEFDLFQIFLYSLQLNI